MARNMTATPEQLARYDQFIKMMDASNPDWRNTPASKNTIPFGFDGAGFGNANMDPLYTMAAFYNVPYEGPSTDRYYGPVYPKGMGSGGGSGGGSGSSGGGGGTPYVPPPVTVPPVQGTGGGFTGVPGMNGAPGGYGVNLMTPPPMGSGAQWRNTMKYGA